MIGMARELRHAVHVTSTVAARIRRNRMDIVVPWRDLQPRWTLTDNTTRRDMLTNIAKVVPLAAVAMVAGEQSSSAAPKGGNSATALVNTTSSLGSFVGTLNVTGVQLVGGVLNAVGTITGTVLGPTGAVVGTVTQAFQVPLQVSGSCQILTLVLGPLHLNLLGLVVDLNQVVLNITAVPGAGNLLGNLLCAVANLLNGGGPLDTLLNNIVSVLNQILGSL
ncbi:MAG TPA: hypothetical protein VNR64_11920 [Vicinamibacterales bacterium]|nr:hypothetical protein [Vicinamibacterales bacterium]